MLKHIRQSMMVLSLSVLMILLMAPEMQTSYAASKPGRPSISAFTNSATSIELDWGRVSGASGYQVYRSRYKNGGYYRVKTLKGGSGKVWTDRNLEAESLYWYKVRAYKKSHSKYIYGKFSKPDNAMASSKPYYYQTINIDSSRDGITYIDVEFANYTTHDIVFRESNLNVYILDFDQFLEDDESLMEENTEIVNIYDSSNNFSAYYYPDEVRVKPGEDITITFETDEYRVDYDPEYSRVISDVDYCGRSYAVIFSNWDDPAPIRDARRPELAAKHQGISRAQKKQ